MKKNRQQVGPRQSAVREWAHEFNLDQAWTVSTYCTDRHPWPHKDCRGKANHFGDRVQCCCPCHELGNAQ